MAMELPTPDDGVDGLLSLADLFSVSQQDLYRFLGYLRDNKASKLIAETRGILVARMVAAEERADPGSDAQVRVAERLGVRPNRRSNLNRFVRDGQQRNNDRADPDWVDQPLPDRTLPGFDEGVDGLLALLPTYDLTVEELFRFLGWPRNSGGAPLIGRTREILAARMLQTRLGRYPAEDYKAAQLAVAKTLGYPVHDRPNYYKRAARGMALLEERGEI